MSQLASTQDNRVKKYHWTNERTELLLEVLIDAIKQGLRADNSFKPETWRLVHTRFRDKGFPVPTERQAISRKDTLKKSWVTWDWLLHHTGFGFNAETQCVEAEDLVWAQAIQTRPAAAEFQGKTLPFWRELDTIF